MAKSLQIFVPGKAESELIADLDIRFAKAEKGIYRQLKEWELNGRYLAGEQWVKWNSYTNELIPAKRPPRGRI